MKGAHMVMTPHSAYPQNTPQPSPTACALFVREYSGVKGVELDKLF